MARPDTKDEQVILQNLWILAASRPDGVEVPCGDAASARRLRFALYNAVKWFKGDKAKPCSEALANAIATCALSFTEDETGVVVRQKIATKVNQAILSVLGDLPLLSDADRQAQESGQRMMQRLLGDVTSEVVPEVSPTAKGYGARS
jgi:hypothetical protein